jgi:hypothetical protein
MEAMMTTLSSFFSSTQLASLLTDVQSMSTRRVLTTVVTECFSKRAESSVESDIAATKGNGADLRDRRTNTSQEALESTREGMNNRGERGMNRLFEVLTLQCGN